MFTPEQIAIVVALVASAGATVAAFINLVGTGRSKYVETITNERIKWVSELRSNFTTLMSDLTVIRSLRKSEDPSKRAKALELKTATYTRMIQIVLKLNRRSNLDKEITDLMFAAIATSKKNDAQGLQRILVKLSHRVSDLLKDEWEKAKWESAGLIRRVPIWWSRLGRWDEHRARWKTAGVTPYADKRDSQFGTGETSESVIFSDPDSNSPTDLVEA